MALGLKGVFIQNPTKKARCAAQNGGAAGLALRALAQGLLSGLSESFKAFIGSSEP